MTQKAKLQLQTNTHRHTHRHIHRHTHIPIHVHMHIYRSFCPSIPNTVLRPRAYADESCPRKTTRQPAVSWPRLYAVAAALAVAIAIAIVMYYMAIRLPGQDGPGPQPGPGPGRRHQTRQSSDKSTQKLCCKTLNNTHTQT